MNALQSYSSDNESDEEPVLKKMSKIADSGTNYDDVGMDISEDSGGDDADEGGHVPIKKCSINNVNHSNAAGTKTDVTQPSQPVEAGKGQEIPKEKEKRPTGTYSSSDANKDRIRPKEEKNKISRHSDSRYRRSRSRERNRSRSREKNRSKSRERSGRSKSKERNIRSSRERNLRSRSKERNNRSRSEDKNRSRSKDSNNRSSSKERKNRSRSRSKERNRSRSRERNSKERNRSRSRERNNRDNDKTVKDRKDFRDYKEARKPTEARGGYRRIERRSSRRSRSRSRDRRRSRSRSRSRDRRKRRSRSRSRSRSRDRKRPHEIRREAQQKLAAFKASNPDFDHNEMLKRGMEAQFAEVQKTTGVALPTYYNPAVMNPVKIAEQERKKKLLWGNKSKPAEAAAVVPTQPPAVGSETLWANTKFSNDTDGKMAEKFKRLMGVKAAGAAASAAAVAASTSSNSSKNSTEILEKQETLFNSMEKQYEVARLATHTQRGYGLGFSSQSYLPK